jgi:hypothetical protein
MKNPVMNYAQFMSKAKGAKAGYDKKANVSQNDKGGTRVKQDLSNLEGKGKDKNTAVIQRYTKDYLSKVAKKTVVKGK